MEHHPPDYRHYARPPQHVDSPSHRKIVEALNTLDPMLGVTAAEDTWYVPSAQLWPFCQTLQRKLRSLGRVRVGDGYILVLDGRQTIELRFIGPDAAGVMALRFIHRN